MDYSRKTFKDGDIAEVVIIPVTSKEHKSLRAQANIRLRLASGRTFKLKRLAYVNEGSNGLFASFLQEKCENKNYEDKLHPETYEGRAEFSDKVLEAYHSSLPAQQSLAI